MTGPAQEQKASRLGPWVERPLPPLTPEIAPFWEGLRQHEFRLCRCRRCGACYFPYTVCVRHADIPDFSEMEWAATSGSGTVFAHLTVHKVVDPAYAPDIPYVLALIELDEGPLFATRIVDCDPGDVRIGRRAAVKYHDVAGAEHTLPFFVLQDGS